MLAPPSPRRHPLTAALSLAGVVVVGLAIGVDGRPSAVTRLAAAAPVDSQDLDLDGIPALQEFVLGTSEFLADSDADGFEDSEELARGSDPLDAASTPEAVGASELRVGMTARGERHNLRLHIAIFAEDGQFNTSVLRIGALLAGQVVSVPFDRLLPAAEVRDVEVPGGAVVRTIDLELDPNLVHAYGAATIFLAVGQQGLATYQSAAKVDLFSSDQTLLLRREPLQATQQGAPTGGGSFRQPIPATGPTGVPQTWVPGQICYQRSQVTGIVGSKVVHEVVSSTCLGGWDTFCPSDCSQSIGATYETIDPASLIGG